MFIDNLVEEAQFQVVSSAGKSGLGLSEKEPMDNRNHIGGCWMKLVISTHKSSPSVSRLSLWTARISL